MRTGLPHSISSVTTAPTTAIFLHAFDLIELNGDDLRRDPLETRLDRLARSTRDLLNILDAVGQAGAAFKSLGDAWADTTTPHGRLMLTVLGGLAEFERELILARTGAGRDRAKAQGVHFSRPPSLTPHQRREAMERLAQGSAQAELARSYGVSQSTISRLAAPGPFEASAVGA
jgi:DNA invertase Pin-like site-specific DNA recombinase